MKIRIFRAFPDSFRKSMEIYADQLLNGVRALLKEGEHIDDVLPPGIRLSGFARYWDQYVRYQSFSKSVQADVNHIIDHGYGHLAHGMCGNRTIVTVHDLVVNHLRTSWRTRFSVRYSFNALRKVARIITDSKASREDFLAITRFPMSRVHVIYPGVDSAFHPMNGEREDLRKHFNIPARSILHVGHNLPYMNVERIFSAFEILVHRLGIEASLVKVGPEFSRKQQEMLHRLKLEKHVRHLGKVSKEDLVSIYNCCDVLLYPALYTGFGLPPLEAMACGVPVICSDRGSLPEVSGDAAILVNPEDPEMIADRLVNVLSDAPLREYCIAQGLERSKQYTWEKTSTEILAVYRDVFNNNNHN